MLLIWRLHLIYEWMMIYLMRKRILFLSEMLILCDEVFAGTNPEAAGLLSTNVIRKIMNSDNVVSLIATHNIKPTELEKNSNLIRNLYMEVDTSNNDVKHKYKIKQGLEKQSIAESIVRKFQKNKIIKNGNDILGSPI